MQRRVFARLLEDAQKKNPFPCPCSYRTALTYYLDLTSHPNTQILKEIAQYATDEIERALLTLMGSYSEEGKVSHMIDRCILAQPQASLR